MRKEKMGSVQGSKWGGKQTGSVKRMGSNYFEFKIESNGSMNYEKCSKGSQTLMRPYTLEPPKMAR